jgi:hypothetical protein
MDCGNYWSDRRPDCRILRGRILVLHLVLAKQQSVRDLRRACRVRRGHLWLLARLQDNEVTGVFGSAGRSGARNLVDTEELASCQSCTDPPAHGLGLTTTGLTASGGAATPENVHWRFINS